MAARPTAFMKNWKLAPSRGASIASHAAAARRPCPAFHQLLALALVLALSGGAALATEVTVVGSPPGSSCCNLALPAAPPSPGGLLQPNLGEGPAGPSFGQFYQPDGAVGPGGPNAPGPDLVLCPARPSESDCYARIDYFRWIEPRDGDDQVTESGALYTLGYARRIGGERLRGELFGGAMQTSSALTDSGFVDPLQTSTSYIGVRGEYEHLWNLYDQWPAVFLGIGTRIWVRDIRDSTTDSGIQVQGEQQTWWTIYPYVGLEKKWLRDNGSELFFSGRLGGTVLTFQRISWPDEPAYYPRPGITGQLECGWRSPRFFISAYFEAMTWQQSQTEHLHYGTDTDYYSWPASQMYTTGLKLGWCF
jgi:hypothetical protein